MQNSWRRTRKLSVAIAFAAGLSLSAQVLPDFDAREAAVAEAPRTSELTALAARRRTAQPGTRIVANRFGLPRTFARDGQNLTAASADDPVNIARAFLRRERDAFAFTDREIADMRVQIRDVTPQGTWVVLQQTVGGIDVFEGQIKFTMNRAGEIVQVAGGEVSAGIVMSTTPGLTAEEAERRVIAAGQGSFARKTELIVFPLNATSARLAYRMFLELDAERFYELVVDADTGQLLFRHNLYVNVAQGRVWAESPGKGTRDLVAFPDAWLPAGGTVTTGNNVDAFVDANGDDRPDTSTSADIPNGRAVGAGQVFDFPFGDGLSAQDPRGFKPAAVTNLFYFVNTAHDFFYSLGFTETSANFQTDNLGRGGTGNDAVLAAAQHAASTNNASFAATPEGTAPRMRLGIFTRGTSTAADDLDSAFDGGVVMHEYGHGVSIRLVGAGRSTSCLRQIQSGGMGEGWSDYFATSFFNTPVTGEYLTQNTTRGIRRQSYEGYTFTYEDIGNAGYEVHRDGEIWAATLWDLRKSLGAPRTDSLVLNGLKGTPCNPSMIDARDAILAADQAASNGANRQAIWTVFARHGMGASASGTDGTQQSGTIYNSATDLPADLQPTRNPAITSNPATRAFGLGEAYQYTVAATNPNGGALNYLLTTGPAGMSVDPVSGAVTWTATFSGQRVKITVTDGRGGRVVHGYLARAFTQLQPDSPVTIDAPVSMNGYAAVEVPAGVPVLQVTLRGAGGDADLAVVNPDGRPETSGRDGSNETLTFDSPKPGRWLVQVNAFAAYTGIRLRVGLVTPTLLPFNTTVSGLGDVLGSENLYRVVLPAGGAIYSVSTSGGTGDVDVFVRRSSPALCQTSSSVSTACLFDAVGSAVGNRETVNVNNPLPGDWFINLSGYAAYSDVTMTTQLLGPAPDLIVTKTHIGNFVPGQNGAQYTLRVTNAGTALTTAPVTLTDTLPEGMTATGLEGPGWNCTLATVSCTRSDVLTNGASYPAVTLTVNIAASSLFLVTNTATVSGGGETNTTNNTARDLTVVSAQAVAITTTSLAPGSLGAPYSATLTATGGSAPYTWTVASGTLPPGITLNTATGELAGTSSATATGQFTFNVRAVDRLNTASGVQPLTLVLNGPASAPTITAGGVGPVYSTATTIQPGSWVSIYGTNLAPAVAEWAGDFPTTLGGTQVTVNGRPAFLWFVSPTQINFQAPDDTARGLVDVVVTNAAGSATARVTLANSGPSFSLLDGRHVAGVIATPNGRGAYGGGTYDLLGPAGAFSFNTRPVRAGETLILYGVGFGPTTPAVPAGRVFSGAAPTSAAVSITIGGAIAPVTFAGVTGAGLYQFNVTVPPNTLSGERALVATLTGGVRTVVGAVVTVADGQ